MKELEERYKKETGKDAYRYEVFPGGPIEYENSYVEWLKNKVLKMKDEIQDLNEYIDEYA